MSLEQSAYESVSVFPKPPAVIQVSTPKEPKPVSPVLEQKVTVKQPKEIIDRPVPTKGWPSEWYELKMFAAGTLKVCSFGKVIVTPSIPAMNAKEHAEYSAGKLGAQLSELRAQKQRIIAVLNSKGGVGKTALAVHLAAVIAEATTFPTLLVDANENNGTTAKRIGVLHEQTIPLRSAIANRTQLKTFSVLARRAGVHKKYPLFVIASDPDSDEDVLIDDFVDMVKIVHSDVGTTVLDCGNGTAWAANAGSVKVADDLVFTAKADDDLDRSGPQESNDSFDALITTMATYLKDHSSKVRRSFVAINAVRKGQDADYCIKGLDIAAKKVGLKLKDLGITKERLFLIPYSKHISKDRVVDLDPAILSYPTKIGLLETAVAILGQDVKSAFMPPSAEAFSTDFTPQHA